MSCKLFKEQKITILYFFVLEFNNSCIRRHGRKTLDVTLTVRYAGVPNNAKLELVKAAKARTETDVMIALQLADGQRLQDNFSPNTTLWRLLEHFEHQPSV